MNDVSSSISSDTMSMMTNVTDERANMDENILRMEEIEFFKRGSFQCPGGEGVEKVVL
jgi:hypothetical protein